MKYIYEHQDIKPGLMFSTGGKVYMACAKTDDWLTLVCLDDGCIIKAADGLDENQMAEFINKQPDVKPVNYQVYQIKRTKYEIH